MTLMSVVCRFFKHPAGLGGRSDAFFFITLHDYLKRAKGLSNSFFLSHYITNSRERAKGLSHSFISEICMPM